MAVARDVHVRRRADSLLADCRPIPAPTSPAYRHGMAGLLVVAAIGITAGNARATPVTYDGAADFSITNGNPNGTWSYGYETSNGSALTLYTSTKTDGYGPMYFDQIHGNVAKNTSGGVFFGVAPGQLTIHPGPSTEPSVVRWTAPAGISSTVSIVGQFFAGDIGTMQVGIFLDNNWATPLFQAIDHGAFSFLQAVVPGTTIDFAVYGGYAFGNTPLDARISGSLTPVPEIDPAGMGSVLAFVTGALGLLERRRKRA